MPNVTGRKLLKQPSVMQMIVNAKTNGASTSQIAKECKVSRDVVRAALTRPESRQFEALAIDSMSRIVEKQLKQYEAALDKGKLKEASFPISTGIYLDKISQLKGDQSGRTLINDSGPTVTSMLAELKAMKLAAKPVNLQVNLQVNQAAAEPVTKVVGT